MKKILLLSFFLLSVSIFSQISVFEAKRSTDRAVVEKFIRDNPKHPAVPELQQRALSLKYAGNPQVAKPSITTMTENKIEKTRNQMIYWMILTTSFTIVIFVFSSLLSICSVIESILKNLYSALLVKMVIIQPIVNNITIQIRFSKIGNNISTLNILIRLLVLINR